jgi:predicted phage terminase large subunit-like protein
MVKAVLQCRDGNEWFIVCLPAVCEREDDILKRKVGEILWPEWFTEEMFRTARRNPRTWSSLYQQRPAPDTGTYFKAEWFKTYEQNPRTGYPAGLDQNDLNVYGASDYAVTKDSENYTVHIVVGVDNKDNIYVLDLWRRQASSDVWVEKFCDMIKEWKPMGWAEETGQINLGVGPFLAKRMRERHAYVVRAQFSTSKSKARRAQSIMGRMAMNGLYCPFAADWFPEFRRELLTFDAGKFDDQVDALGLIGQVLDKMIPAQEAAGATEPLKLLSTDPEQCTVTLEDLFEANEEKRAGILRIN